MTEKTEQKPEPSTPLQIKMCEKFEALFQKHFHNSPYFSDNPYIVNLIQAFKAEDLATLREK